MALFRLQTREARKKLAPRDAPYFLELRRGLAIGYRRGMQGGSWELREYRRDLGKYVKRRLGVADDELTADGVTVLSWEHATSLALRRRISESLDSVGHPAKSVPRAASGRTGWPAATKTPGSPAKSRCRTRNSGW